MPGIDAAALAAENEELLGFLYMCPVGILKLDVSGAVQVLNPHAAQLLMPIAPQGMIVNLLDLLQNWAPELRNLVDGFGETSGSICENHRVFLGRRQAGPSVLSFTFLKVDAGCIMALLSDVSRQVEQESRLRQTESWFAALLSGVRDFALFSLDAQGRIDSWSSSALRQTGFSAAEAAGCTMHRFYHSEEDRQGRAAEQIDCASREGWHLDEGWCVRKDGSRFWCQILVAAIEGMDGLVSGFSVVLRDTTERRLTSEELRRLLTTDYLTGATNRAHFSEMAEREMLRHGRYGGALSVIMLDIDHFKRVNDTFGHAFGDRLLRVLAESCRAELRATDVFARLGGEEFVVLLPGIDLDEAAATAERLRARVAHDLACLDAMPVQATISLGCATMAPDGCELDTMLEAADQALYRAKRLGRNRVEVAVPVSAGPVSAGPDSAGMDYAAVAALLQPAGMP